MAHKKAGGSTSNGRTSRPKYRGIKRSDGQFVRAGEIIARQCGSHWHHGDNTAMGRDYTVYALKEGHVKFTRGGKDKKVRIHVL